MSDVVVTTQPDLAEKRLGLVLVEDRVGHYPEFRDFFTRTFRLDEIGLAEPGYVSAPSGEVYALIFLGRSGEPFPSGVEIHAVVDALEALEEATVDRDLWAILGWMIDGVGAPWSREALQRTGALYRIPAVGPAPVSREGAR